MIGRAGVALLLVLLASPASAEDVGEVAARVHREGGYAGQLPIAADVDGSGRSPGGGVGEDERAGGVPGPRRSEHAPLPSALPLVRYGLVALAIAALVTLLIATLARPRRRVTLASAPASPPAPPRASNDPLDLDADPDALARDGRFAEAITAALIRGLRATGGKPDGAERSRTAREILASVDTDDARRSALTELLGIAERVAFGGDEPTRERWDAARLRWMQLDGGAPK